MSKVATVEDGVRLCKQLYPLLKTVGLFPALSGGLLYKEGERKDIDIVIFRHRQDLETFEMNNVIVQVCFKACGVEITNFYGFVTKAKWEGFDVDFFNPETTITNLEDVYQ